MFRQTFFVFVSLAFSASAFVLGLVNVQKAEAPEVVKEVVKEVKVVVTPTVLPTASPSAKLKPSLKLLPTASKSAVK